MHETHRVFSPCPCLLEQVGALLTQASSLVAKNRSNYINYHVIDLYGNCNLNYCMLDYLLFSVSKICLEKIEALPDIRLEVTFRRIYAIYHHTADSIKL